jgi:hypothetical protein
MNETSTSQPVVKPKRQLSEAQKAALKKGRESLAKKRRAVQEDTVTELVEEGENKVVSIYDETQSPDTFLTVCASLSIVLLSYFIMFMVSQHV